MLLGGLVLWGISLGAWLAVAATVGWMALIAMRRSPRGQAGLALAVVLLGTPEVLWCVDRIGARARTGDLGWRDKVAVAGFNQGFGLAAHAAGFGAFGRETMALSVPWSVAGACPEDRLARYGRHLPRAYPGHVPRLRRWASALPQRAPRIRAIVAGWAASLPSHEAPPQPFERVPVPQWNSRDYIAEDAANQVAVALSTPTTGVSGTARWVDGRWVLEVAVDLALAYPEQSTLQIGPFALEEGMFHDARPLLQPYCLEYEWSVAADDPALTRPGADRGPLSRGSTWALRMMGAGYR